MQANVGSTDRIIRVIIGLALIAGSATHTIGPWGYIGIVAVLTGVFRFCPAYLPFGLSTCKTRQ